ncbi:MAG: hypothetical protein ACI8XO_000770 [Verrucomicrobiales bacterium]
MRDTKLDPDGEEQSNASKFLCGYLPNDTITGKDSVELSKVIQLRT